MCSLPLPHPVSIFYLLHRISFFSQNLFICQREDIDETAALSQPYQKGWTFKLAAIHSEHVFSHLCKTAPLRHAEPKRGLFCKYVLHLHYPWSLFCSTLFTHMHQQLDREKAQTFKIYPQEDHAGDAFLSIRESSGKPHRKSACDGGRLEPCCENPVVFFLSLIICTPKVNEEIKKGAFLRHGWLPGGRRESW